MKKIIILTAACAMTMAGCKKGPEYTYSEEEVVRQDVVTSVTATGTIEPVTSVEVGTQVSGIVSKIYVDYNSVVKAGQVIAELDRTNLMSELESAQAKLKSAQSDMAYKKLNYQRYKNLYDKGLVSANDYDDAKLKYDQAKQTVVEQQQSVEKAQTNLGYATITSPINGVVLSKEVEEGQTVASSFSTPTLFTIAQDLTQMRVILDVDEADIGEVREGQRVVFTVDAYPDDTFQGTVAQVRQEATTESNVVTYEVVVTAPNDDLKLKPGLTANATIYTLEAKNAIAISTKALRFKPSTETLNEGESINDAAAKAEKKVWVKEGNVLKSYAVETGTTNGTLIEIKGGLKPGQKVITGSENGSPDLAEGEQQNSNPFMPHPKSDKKDSKK